MLRHFSWVTLLFIVLLVGPYARADEKDLSLPEKEVLPIGTDLAKEEVFDPTVPWAYAPKVSIITWGSTDLRVIVEFDPKMDAEKLEAVQVVRLETEDGKRSLGNKTYEPDETTRRADFLLDPQVIQVDKIKVVVNSKIDGDWSGVYPLAESSEWEKITEAEAAKAVEKEKPKEKAPKKKKKWFW